MAFIFSRKSNLRTIYETHHDNLRLELVYRKDLNIADVDTPPNPELSLWYDQSSATHMVRRVSSSDLREIAQWLNNHADAYDTLIKDGFDGDLES